MKFFDINTLKLYDTLMIVFAKKDRRFYIDTDSIKIISKEDDNGKA